MSRGGTTSTSWRCARRSDRARSIEPDDFLVLYNAACSLAQLGDVEPAIAALEHALPSALEETRSWLRLDSDLDPLRGHPRFRALLARLAITP
mgnify:CR=1 FL=1